MSRISFGFALLLVTFAVAADEAPNAATPNAAAAMRVYRDPQTGQLLPAPASAEHRAIANQGAVKRDDSRMRAETVPGVGVLLHLNGQIRPQSVVRRGADGRFEESCVNDEVQKQ